MQNKVLYIFKSGLYLGWVVEMSPKWKNASILSCQLNKVNESFYVSSNDLNCFLEQECYFLSSLNHYQIMIEYHGKKQYVLFRF